MQKVADDADEPVIVVVYLSDIDGLRIPANELPDLSYVVLLNGGEHPRLRVEEHVMHLRPGYPAQRLPALATKCSMLF